MQVKGIIRSNSIELIEHISLAEGTEVVIEISENTQLNKKTQWQKLEKVIGSWETNAEIDSIFQNLDEERHQYSGRDINFEDFS